MPSATVTTSTQLRNAIQLAGPGDVITLSGAGPFSVGTLAKLTSTTLPTNPGGGYQIVGDGITPNQTITDTRIYQANIDGANAPSVVKDLTLNYTSGNTAILNAKTGSYTIDNVSFTGTHTGWTGNGNNYISLTASNPLTPTTSTNNSTLIFKDSDVSINGKPGNGFNGTSGGAAFIQSWNNMGGATLQNNTFDESGYLAAFQFFNSSTAATNLGTYTITGNTFSRTTDKTTRSRGERLENVEANLSGNIFNDGSYLDLYGNVSGVDFVSNNTFNTIAGGYGIRATQVSGSTGATLGGSPMFSGTLTFTGSGLALKYISTTSPTPDGSLRYSALNGFIVNGVTFDRLSAGSQVNDSITTSGITNRDWVNGDDGNDTISTSGGNDFVLGGTGNDTINGGNDNDTIEGGSGADSLDGGNGTDTLSYASSPAAVTVNLLTNTVSGGDATGDTIVNFENIIGSAFADNLTGDTIANTIFGGLGNDTIDGGFGNDNIDGGSDNDSLSGGVGNDTILGGEGMDTILGGADDDSIFGGNGNDTIDGELGADTIDGGDGDDFISGGGGNDSINGGNGNDSITGGGGVDTLTGGSGNDQFRYNNTTAGGDIITDFTTAAGPDQDNFAFASANFGGLPAGTLNAANFTTTTPSGAVPTFIYIGGVLSFDLDGTGGGSAVNIATLTGSPALTNTLITIF